MPEKREYHRFKINAPMDYLVPPRRDKVSTTTLDLGGTGLLFETTDPLRVRQELLIYLSLDGQAPIEMHAKVVRIEQDPARAENYYVGVRIADNMKFDERQYVKFYARKLNALPEAR